MCGFKPQRSWKHFSTFLIGCSTEPGCRLMDSCFFNKEPQFAGQLIGIPTHCPGNSQRTSAGLFRLFSSMCCSSARDCGVTGEAYVYWVCMCFLIRCKMGPWPLRQGPWQHPCPSTSVPSSPARQETASLSRTGSETEQIGGTYAISCRRAQGADALSPNRFSCYQL